MRGINIPQFTKIEKEGIYLTKQLVLIGTPGYGFHALLNMPDPTLLTKLAAIADGIVLMERVVNFKRRVEKLMDEPFIPVSWDIGIPSLCTNSNYLESSIEVAFNHRGCAGSDCELDEHYRNFSIEFGYTARYLEENGAMWHNFMTKSPRYAIRLHCPDRNPPETEGK